MPFVDTAATGMFRTRLAFGIMLLALLAYVFNAWRWGTIADTSWLITVIERLDAGDRLFVDVVELNPPFSIWLYMPAVRFAALVGVAPESIVRLYTILICLTGTMFAGWMLTAGRLVERRPAMLVSMALFAITVLISGDSFSERDQIGSVLCLPLLILAAWRASPKPAERPSTAHWLVAGVGGGVLAMVKPYYAVVVVAAACLLAWRRRDLRVFFLPEFLLSGTITAGYLALIYIQYPVFFETLLPLLRETYMAYRRPIASLSIVFVFWFPLFGAYLLIRQRIVRCNAADFLMVASVAALLPYFLQGKGWNYHAYPALFFASSAVVLGAVSWFAKHPAKRRAYRPIALALTTILAAHMIFWPTTKPANALTASLPPGETPTVGMLGGDIAVAHPLSRMIAGRWIDPYCSDWVAVYAVRQERALAKAGNTGEAQRFRTMTSDYLAGKKQRFISAMPQVLIVDRNDDLVSILLNDYGFQSLLDHYDRVAESGGVELYRLVLRTGMDWRSMALR